MNTVTNSELETAVRHFVRESPHNRIAEEDAFEPRLVGMRIHDEPLIGFASAQRCSTEWLHARIEGQLFLNEATDFVQQILLAQGSRVVCPSSSKDFV